MEDALADIFNTFPDWHMEIESIVASGDQVVVREADRTIRIISARRADPSERRQYGEHLP